MSKKVTRFEREAVYRESFLARLSGRLGAPTVEWPTVRCWGRASLHRLFREVHDELAAEGIKSDTAQHALLEWLGRLGLARPLAVEGETFHVFDFGANAGVEADPVELLLAAKPSGVVCYLSALIFHSLTTQPAAHHHVAHLQAPAPDSRSRRPGQAVGPVAGSDSAGDPTPRRPSFGTPLFLYQGVPYYHSRRSARLAPGVQTREYGPRTRVRITTPEQTLLDAFSRPFHCGGPEVVFEAWREATESGRLDERRVVEYLQSMAYPATTRRLAVMLGLVGGKPGPELRRLLEECRASVDRESPYAVISLLPGVGYSNLNRDWLVNTP